MNGNARIDRRVSETTPLLRESSPSTISEKHRGWALLKLHLTSHVNKSWGDLILLWCYIITGLLDSSAVSIWGSFVSMQTGNTIYLGLGLIAPTGDVRWIKALTSISAFCLGSFFFSRFHRYFGPRIRWVLIVSYIIQLLLIVAAALIVTFGHDETDGKDSLSWQLLVPLAAVAFQSSGQAITSRVLQYGGLTSVVLTSNYCDLFSDENLFTLDNVQRNRRIAAPILLLIGAMFGGMWAHSPIGLTGALWTAAGMKTATIIAWVIWAPDPDEEFSFFGPPSGEHPHQRILSI